MQSPVINPVFLTGSTDTWPLAELAEMGYKGLEVTPACLGKPRTYEMPVACVNASPELTPYLTGSLHDGVERRRRTTIDHLLGVLKTMNTEGIPMLVIAPGRLAENYQTVDQARALLVSSAKELSDAAGDVAVLIASAPRRLFARSGELAGVIDDIGRPNVAAALDVGHAMLSGETPGDAARALGSRLRYVQVHDADVRPGMPRIDRHLPMGNGSAKREDLVDILKGRVVAITVTAPNDPIGSARESLKWIHA
jgi:sugar phosphate isomerase/epimerase